MLHPDGNLLVAILALQNGFVRQDTLVAAMHAWVADKSRSLGQILVERGDLSAQRLTLLEALVKEEFSARPATDRPGLPTTLPDQAAPPPPRFRVIKHHRHGGLGDVFLANDEELGREVALKQIRGLHADGNSRARFVEEAAITGGLEHPGVVPVYSLGSYADGRPYYAMRFIRGDSLHDALHRFHDPQATKPEPEQRALQERQFLERFVSICQTLAYAHSRGVIHRDLKPSNIMLGPFGETLVVDWGLAKLLPDAAPELRNNPLLAGSNAAGRRRTMYGSPLGTPEYMAPEQAAGRTDLHGVPCDVYGLGAILFEILTGRPPYVGTSTDEVLRQVLGGSTPRVRDHCPTAPEALDEIVARAMSRDPTERHASAAELATDVQRWMLEGPVVAYRKAEQELARQVAEKPDVAELREELARTRVTLGLVLGGMGRNQEAAQAFSEAVDSYAHLIEGFPGQTRYRADRAAARIHFSHVLARLGYPEAAGHQQREAVAEYELLIATNPDDYHTNLASVMLTLMPGVARPGARSGQASPPRPDDSSTLAAASSVPDEEFEITPHQTDGSPLESIRPLDDPELTAHPATTDASDGADATFMPAVYGAPDDAPREVRTSFKLLRLLGQGGSAKVWLAHDSELDREVTLKELTLEATPDALARFRMEAKVTAQLNHPNIIPIHGIGYRAEARIPFMILHYAEGGDLQKAIAAHYAQEPDAPSFTRLLVVFAYACDAIAYAHSRGVINRDPKPLNILLGKNGETFVTDWGLAVVSDSPFEGTAIWEVEWSNPIMQQETNQLVGTPAYIAPELINGGKANARTDIYVLGGGLFQILTGQSPRKGGNMMEMLRSAVETGAPRARTVNPSVPPALDSICARAMATNPDDRYQSAADLARDVRRWLASESVPVPH